MNDKPNFIQIHSSIRFPIKSYSDKRVKARFWMEGRKMNRTGEQIIKDHLKGVEKLCG